MYEFRIEVGVKQRRFTEKQFASVGGVWLAVRNWNSLTAGNGTGSLAMAAPSAAGAIASAAVPQASTVIARMPFLMRANLRRTICTSIIAGIRARADTGNGRRIEYCMSLLVLTSPCGK